MAHLNDNDLDFMMAAVAHDEADWMSTDDEGSEDGGSEPGSPAPWAHPALPLFPQAIMLLPPLHQGVEAQQWHAALMRLQLEFELESADSKPEPEEDELEVLTDDDREPEQKYDD